MAKSGNHRPNIIYHYVVQMQLPCVRIAVPAERGVVAENRPILIKPLIHVMWTRR